MTIIMAAPIGAGKTSVADYLSRAMGLQIIHEPIDENKILKLYYQDQSKYGFLLQMYLLQRRTQDLHSAYALESTSNKQVISDRSLYEDLSIFATQLHDSGKLLDEEFDVYKNNAITTMRLLDQINASLNNKPDLLIYLNPSFERTLAQIKKRNRPFEQYDNNPELKAYYRDIYNRYQDWYNEYQRGPKICLTDYSVDTHDDRVKLYQSVIDKAETINYHIN